VQQRANEYEEITLRKNQHNLHLQQQQLSKKSTQSTSTTTTTLELEDFICDFGLSCYMTEFCWEVVKTNSSSRYDGMVPDFQQVHLCQCWKTNCPILKHVLNGFYYWQFFIDKLAVCMPLCAACKQPVGLAPVLALVQVLWVKCLCKVWVTYVLLHPVFSTFLLNNSYTTMQVEHTHTYTHYVINLCVFTKGYFTKIK
jgi:hypothetical protein